jgi:Lsr2
VAQRMQTLFIDDIDGSEAESTVRFGVDGTDYEIDLSAAHAEEFQKAVQKYVAAGRKVGGARRGAKAAPARGPSQASVREWAKSEGIAVKDRGRVPAELVVRFQEAATK